MNKCIDCNKKLPNNHKKNSRCRKCYYKYIKIYPQNYKDGRTITKHYCTDCGNKLAYYTAIRCKKCATKKYMKTINFMGKNNPNYKDGRTSLEQLIRNLEEYKTWRNKVFKRDNYTCQDCLQISNGNIEAHHKKSFSYLITEFLQYYNQFSPIEDKEVLVRLATNWKPFWEIYNGETLCKSCHKQIKEKVS